MPQIVLISGSVGQHDENLTAQAGWHFLRKRKSSPQTLSMGQLVMTDAGRVVALARRFSPAGCGSAAECYRLTRDARDAVRLMIRPRDSHASTASSARISPGNAKRMSSPRDVIVSNQPPSAMPSASPARPTRAPHRRGRWSCSRSQPSSPTPSH